MQKTVKSTRKTKILKYKETEISSLKIALSDYRIMQIDVSVDTNETKDENKTSDDSEKSSGSQNCFKCDLCNFETKFKSGLKIHLEKKHNHYCEKCEKVFRNENHFKRHMKAEMIMENSDPITSPDKSTALSINELGEPWIDVVKTESLCSIAVLYFEEHHHEKTELLYFLI